VQLGCEGGDGIIVLTGRRKWGVVGQGMLLRLMLACLGHFGKCLISLVGFDSCLGFGLDGRKAKVSTVFVLDKSFPFWGIVCFYGVWFV
jgi:hypothetical protein